MALKMLEKGEYKTCKLFTYSITNITVTCLEFNTILNNEILEFFFDDHNYPPVKSQNHKLTKGRVQQTHWNYWTVKKWHDIHVTQICVCTLFHVADTNHQSPGNLYEKMCNWIWKVSWSKNSLWLVSRCRLSCTGNTCTQRLSL